MKKHIKLFIYFFFLVLIIASFVFLLMDYYSNLQKGNGLVKKAKAYHILNQDGEISFSLEKERVKVLEEQLLEQYHYTNINDVGLELDSVSEVNKTLEQEVSQLEQEVQDLDTKKNQLDSQYWNLQKQKEEALAEAREIASTYQIDGVITMNQYPNYPTECECVALSILLKYYGITTSVDDIIGKLPQGGWLYTKDGVRYGGNPEVEFVGSPYDGQSFGVYEGPIINVANTYKSGMINGRGNSLDAVLDIVKQGRPVMVWTTINLLQPYVIASWIYDKTLEQVNWYAHEHVVVIVGFSDHYVIVSDPNDGSIKKQRRDLFESRYNSLGRRNVYY